MSIKKEYLIEKRNVLNEIRSNSMNLQELRFFSIYLAKINARDISSRVVRFTLSDFQKIMELGKLNLAQLRQTIDRLLSKIVGVTLENGGFKRFHLFSSGLFSQDNNGNWYVEIDADDNALPLMFEFKERYFTYELWNALRLKSSNQLRMYEILKQHERIGERVFALNDLKELLGLNVNDYVRFGDFKTYVLETCKKALQEHTDIKFTYEPYGKKGRGGKVLFLKFYIKKNKSFKDKLTLDVFMEECNQERIQEHKNTFSESDLIADKSQYVERIEFFMEACHNEFTFAEVETLNNKLRDHLSEKEFMDQIRCFNYIHDRYKEMLRNNEKKIILHHFGYVRSLIGREF